jgi:hypothetical protein
VPLLEPNPDASIDLNALVASVYGRGAYGAQIDYRRPQLGRGSLRKMPPG